MLPAYAPGSRPWPAALLAAALLLPGAAAVRPPQESLAQSSGAEASGCDARRELCDEEQLPGCVIQLIVNPPPPLKTYFEKVEPEALGSHLLQKIVDRTSLPRGSFWLLAGNRHLLAEETLDSQGIRHDSEVKVMLRGRGGVIHGHRADWADNDFVVEVRSGFGGVCTGTIWADRVLTAAHCVVSKETRTAYFTVPGVPASVDEFYLTGEPFYIRAYHAPESEYVFLAESIAVHERYSLDGDEADCDVAVIKLKPVFLAGVDINGQGGTLTRGRFLYFPKTELGLDAGENFVAPGATHILAGFGMSNPDQKATPLRLGAFDGLHVGAFMGFRCPAGSEMSGSVVGPSVACAGGLNLDEQGREKKLQLAACGGDSGGPWYQFAASFLTPKVVLTGVHSGGTDCHRQELDFISSLVTMVGHTPVRDFIVASGFDPPHRAWDGKDLLLGNGADAAVRERCRDMVRYANGKDVDVKQLKCKRGSALQPGGYCVGKCGTYEQKGACEDGKEVALAHGAKYSRCRFASVKKDCGIFGGTFSSETRSICLVVSAENHLAVDA